MSDSLIQQVVTLESEADTMVREAKERAKQLEVQTATAMAETRAQLLAEAHTRVDAYREQASQEQDAALAQTNTDLEAQLGRLAKVNDQDLNEQADHVLSALLQEQS